MNERIEEELLEQKKQGCGERFLNRLGAKKFRELLSYVNAGLGSALGAGAAISNTANNCPGSILTVGLQITQILLSGLCGGVEFYQQEN